jgi:hypothetical protein
VFTVLDTMSNNQSCSSPHTVMDINTPNGSLNNDNDGNTSLTDALLQTLNDCKNFAYVVLRIANEVRRQGYSEIALPKFPSLSCYSYWGYRRRKMCSEEMNGITIC